MTWWAWVLIWAGLGVALIGVLALGAWWLWRKALALMEAVGQLAERGAVLSEVDAEPPDRATPALLRDHGEVRADRAARVHRKREFRRIRRALRLARMERLAAIEVDAVRWPDDWYRGRS